MAAKAKKKDPKGDTGSEPKGTDDRTSSSFTPSEEERTAVKALLSQIDRAKQLKKKFDTETLPALRRHLWGTKTAEQGAESSTRTNLTFATIATLIPHVYAKNPELSVSPGEHVEEKEYDKIKKFAQTCQVLLNHCFVEEAQLKKRSKSNVRSAMVTSVGWIKMNYQESLSGDPIQLRRYNDAQDNIQRIEYLVQSAKESTDLGEQERKRAELKEQMKALEESGEIRMFKGFQLDRVQTEDMFILDESIIDFDDYVHASKLGERIWFTTEKFEQVFGYKPEAGVQKHNAPMVGDVKGEDGETVNFTDGVGKQEYVPVFEVWDKDSNTIYTVAEGSNRWARLPYRPNPVPTRWYQFYCLGFNLVEGRWRPLSDIELIRHLQDEYNTTRYLFAETRKEAIPIRVFRKAGGLTEEDIEKLSKRKARDFIGVEGSPTIPIDQDITQLEGVKIDPTAFDVSIIRNDMDMLVGLSDASRANLIQAKTATEAEIMRQALQLRVSERQDTNEDLIAEMARSAIEIMLKKFTLDDVKQVAGPEAVWPESADPEMFQKINVLVRAGSTGRPNIQKERESWAVLMPLLKDTIKQVSELRLQGQFDMADSLIEILKESIRRYDERLDVDKFIPRPELDENGKPVQQANAVAQAAQMQEQFQQCQEELQQCKEALAKCEQDLAIAKQAEQAKVAQVESDKAIAMAQESSKQADANAKAQAERTKQMTVEAEARATADAEVQMQRDKLESEERQNERNAAAKEYEACVKAAADLLGAEIAAKAQAKAKADKDAEGGETPQEKESVVDVAELLKRQDALTASIQQLADIMRSNSQRRIRVTKEQDGSYSGSPA